MQTKDYNNVGEDDNATVTGVVRRSGRHRLLRLLVLHRERGHAEGVRDRRRRRLRRSVGRDGPGRLATRRWHVRSTSTRTRPCSRTRSQTAFIDYYLANVNSVGREPRVHPAHGRAADRVRGRAGVARGQVGRDRKHEHALMEAGSIGASGPGAGDRSPLEAPSNRYGREGHQGPSRLLRPALGASRRPRSSISLLGPDDRVLRARRPDRLPLRDRLVAELRAGELRRPADRRRHAQRDPLGHALRDPDRARRSPIYLSEYASPRVRKIVKPILEVLAGIPTVAIGFFAVTFIIPDDHPAGLAGQLPRRRQLALHGARRPASRSAC